MKRVHTSYPEKFIYNAIKMVYPQTQNQVKIDCQKLQKQSFDIYIPEKEAYIQYQGYYWHQDNKRNQKTVRRDIDKRWFCYVNGLYLLEVWEDPQYFQKVSDSSKCYFINGLMEDFHDTVVIKPNPTDLDLFRAQNLILKQWGEKLETWQLKYISLLARNEMTYETDKVYGDNVDQKVDKLIIEDTVNRYKILKQLKSM